MEHPDTYTDTTEIENDQLGMAKHYHGIAEFLRTCDTPMTVSIQGDWGTGKTTTMRFIIKELEARAKPRDICAIWFNTWQFSVLCDNNKLIIHLMKMMLDQLAKLAEDHLDAKARESFMQDNKDLLETLAKIIVINIGKTALENIPLVGSGFQALFKVGDNLRELGDSARQEASRKADIINEINAQYDEARLVVDMKKLIEKQIEALTGPGKPFDRIYLFIDDLDRLEPIVAVELMEGIKNFIDCKGCVFVLAVDNEVVERGLQAKFGKEKYGAAFEPEKAKKFFDKIIQVPFRLPVNAYSIQDYVTYFLKTPGNNETDMAERYTALLSGFNESNPRTIKRSFNLFRLQQKIDGAARSKESNLRQYALLLFKLESEHLYEQLFADTIIKKYADEAERSQALEKLWKGEYDDFDMHLNSSGKGRIQAVMQVFFTGDDGDFCDPEHQNTREFTELIQEMTPDVKPEMSGDLLLASTLRDYYKLLIAYDDLDRKIDLDKPETEIAATLRDDKVISMALKRTDRDGLMVRANQNYGTINLTFYTRRSAAELFGNAQHLFCLKRGKERVPEGMFGYYDNTNDRFKPRITVNVIGDMKNRVLFGIVKHYLDTLS